IEGFGRRTGLDWQPAGVGDGLRTFGPDDVLHYVYALFHCPTYRVRFAEPLRTNFPRILWPTGGEMFTALAALGRQLADCHLLRPEADGQRIEPREFPDEPVVIRRQAIRYERGRIWCAPNASWGPVAEEVWQFQVGGYQPCRKWLADRAGRLLTAEAAEHYGRMLASIRTTLDLQATVEQNFNLDSRRSCSL
ncbi:MAG: hypothetical protein J5I93_28485, partial [Pirellulaceae bacterium]|nr:hypothetical protein [Pirellulaceae bacterium]